MPRSHICFQTHVIWSIQCVDDFSKVYDGLFHDMAEDFIEVSMDNLSILGKSFMVCLRNLYKVLARFEDINLVLNCKKCSFWLGRG